MTQAKYAHLYENPQGPGDARPTANQIIADEAMEGKLTGKTIFITGCSSGLGVETARSLALTGAKLYLTARDLPKAREALGDILTSDRVFLIEQDLSSLASVRKSAQEFLKKEKELAILICNAGVMAIPSPGKTTVDGFEMQFGTNHLGHFLLFNLLKPTLLAASTASFNSRVIMVSSSGHRNPGGIRFGNYDFKSETGEAYTPFGAYGQSKTANIYMANYIDRHFGHGSHAIHATSLMPGGIATPLQRYFDPALIEKFSKDAEIQRGSRSTQQGSATTVWAAVGREWEGRGGRYLEDCQEAGAYPPEEERKKNSIGYAPWAFDEEKEERLWRESLVMVGLEEGEL